MAGTVCGGSWPEACALEHSATEMWVQLDSEEGIVTSGMGAGCCCGGFGGGAAAAAARMSGESGPSDGLVPVRTRRANMAEGYADGGSSQSASGRTCAGVVAGMMLLPVL